MSSFTLSCARASCAYSSGALPSVKHSIPISVEVAAGGQHACGVLETGHSSCFGSNSFGQCDVPLDLGPVLAISAGDEHTCAIRTTGRESEDNRVQ